MICHIPFGIPFNLTVKPAGARCNMRCDYCYYLGKKELYEGGADSEMTLDTLETFISDYIASQPYKDVRFVWHGGEALLRPLSFYRKAVELQLKYASTHTISNCIQTNGTLLNDQWCAFFRDNGWLVGLSIDGPEKFHDRYRRMAGGQPSFAKVMKGIELLNRNNVEWNILATVNDYNSRYPEEVYLFLKNLGTPFIQFSPVVERLLPDGKLSPADSDSGRIAPFSIKPDLWGRFLCRVFDLWVSSDVGKVFVQTFDATLANWTGRPAPSCLLANSCGYALALEHNGDIYCCDHYVFPQYRRGNIHDKSFWQVMAGDAQTRFAASKRELLPGKCLQCEFLFACNGECPRNRFTTTLGGEKYLNYLCEGYHAFFKHVSPYMNYMRDLIESGYPPAVVMAAVKYNTIKTNE